jgi:hypothetical protein
MKDYEAKFLDHQLNVIDREIERLMSRDDIGGGDTLRNRSSSFWAGYLKTLQEERKRIHGEMIERLLLGRDED